LSREIPHTSQSGNHELLKTDKECNNPEKTKEEVPHQVVGLFRPLDICNQRILLKFNFTNTVEMYGSEDPVNHEWNANYVSNNRKENNSQIL